MPVFLHLETHRDETKQFRAGLGRLFRQVHHLCDDFFMVSSSRVHAVPPQ